MLKVPILDKLQADIKLEVSRKMNDKAWQIDEIIDILKLEIEARETCGAHRTENSKEVSEKRQFKSRCITTESLHVSSKPIKCAFRKQEHFSDKCTGVGDVNARLEIVRNNRLCYRCLNSMHGIRACRSKAKCYKCRSVRHHTAICNTGETFVSNTRQYMDINREKTPPDNKVALITSNKHAVLLQTIRVSATNVGETEKVRVNVIFDGGSQRTYLSKKFVQMLSLKPMVEQEMRISAFGEADGKWVKVNEYCFVLKGKNEDSFYLRGFDVPVICAPLSNQHLDAVKSKFESVEQLVPQNK